MGLALHDIEVPTIFARKNGNQVHRGPGKLLGSSICLSQWVATSIYVRQLPLMSAGFKM